MSQWGVQLVIGKLVADDAFRQRFENHARDTLTRLCEEGVDLSDAELVAFLETDVRVWAALADRIDRRLRTERSVRSSRSSTQKTFGPLSPRQRQVLRAIFEGRTNKQIAVDLGVSESAVKATLQHLFRKMHVRSRAQLVRVVIEGLPSELSHRTTPAVSKTLLRTSAGCFVVRPT
jgi:DNA-binding CsgD family transcriptional regulator